MTTPLLPSSPPQRIGVAFSRSAHPHPLPNTAPPAISPLTAAQRVAKEAAEAARAAAARREQNRGTGFSAIAVREQLQRAAARKAALESQSSAADESDLQPSLLDFDAAADPARRVSPGKSAALSPAASQANTPLHGRSPRSLASAIGSTSASASTLAAESVPVEPAPSTPMLHSPLASPARAGMRRLRPAGSGALQAPPVEFVSSLPAEVYAALMLPGSARSDAQLQLLEDWLRSLSLEFFSDEVLSDASTMRMLCGRVRYARFNRKDIVMREGTQPDALYVMLVGSVSIWNETYRDFEAIDQKIDEAHAKETAAQHLASPLSPSAASADPTVTEGAALDHSPPAAGHASTLQELTALLGGTPKFVTTILSPAGQPPKVFGELGLMSEQLRTATVIAEGNPIALSSVAAQAMDAAVHYAPTEFLLIDKSDFDAVLKSRSRLGAGFNSRLESLKSLQVFRSVSERQLVKISIYFTEHTMPVHSVVLEQGSVADTIWFLVEGEVEVRETISRRGTALTTQLGIGSGSKEEVEVVSLGLIGAGELISDASVFDSLLVHPWSLIVRSPQARLLSIPADEFQRRIRSDILLNIRRVAYVKKERREEMRAKSFQAKRTMIKRSHAQKQAAKLLKQVSLQRKAISLPLASPALASAAGRKSSTAAGPPPNAIVVQAGMPRKIRATLLKNVVLAGKISAASAATGAANDDPAAAARLRTTDSSRVGAFAVVGQIDGATGALLITGQNSTNAAAVPRASTPAAISKPQTPRLPRNPLDPRSPAASRPFTSPASSQAASLDSPSTASAPSVRFSSTAALPLDVAENAAVDQPPALAPALAEKSEKGDLLKNRTALGLTVGPTVARAEYPFDHIHVASAPAADIVATPAATSAAAVDAPPSPAVRRLSIRTPSIDTQLRSTIESISEDLATPSSGRPRHDRRPSIVQSQIQGHRRALSVHRGSSTEASILPFALADAPKTLAVIAPISESAAQIAAPVLVSPRAASLINVPASNGSVAPSALVSSSHEVIAPVPSFAHLSPSFYQNVPEKQYYGKSFRRPSVTLSAATVAAALASGSAPLSPSQAIAKGLGTGHTAAFQKATPQQDSESKAATAPQLGRAASIARATTPATARSPSPAIPELGSPPPTEIAVGAADAISPRSSLSGLPSQAEPPRAQTARVASCGFSSPAPPSSRPSVSAHSARPAIATAAPIPLRSTADIDDDVDEFLDESTGGSRNRALADATRKALADDPLLLQKENVKWSRQLDAWHRALVVPPSSFLGGGVVDAAEKALSLPLGAGVDASTGEGAAPQLTPPNVDVFTTLSELNPAQMASPLSLIPRALPIASVRFAVPYLYPTARETGSIAQTRGLNTALGNLHDAIASGFTVPELTRGQQAAQEAAQRIDIANKLEEEIAYKRLLHRMKPEEELIARTHYIPRSIRAHVSTTQALKRHKMLVDTSALGAGLVTSGPVFTLDSSVSEWVKARAERRRAIMDSGSPKRKTRKQRAMEAEAAEAEKLKQAEAAEQLARLVSEAEEEDAVGRSRQRRSRSDDGSATLDDVSSLAELDPLSLTDPRNLPYPGHESGRFLPLHSPVYSEMLEAEREITLLQSITRTLERDDGMFLRGLLLPEADKFLTAAAASEVAGARSESVPNDGRMLLLPFSPGSVEKSSTVKLSKFMESLAGTPRRSTLPSPGSASASATASVAALKIAKDFESLALPSASSRARRSSGVGLGARTPHLTSDERVLHTGTLELNQDRELEFGKQWAYFEDRAPSKRMETFERLLQQHPQGTANQAQAMQQSLQLSRSASSSSISGSHRRRSSGEPVNQALLEAEDAQRQLVQRKRLKQLQEDQLEQKLVLQHAAQEGSGRVLLTLTPREQGPQAILGNAAPRLYHWAAMMQSNPAAAEENTRPGISSADCRPRTAATAASPSLSVEAMTLALQQPVPNPPLPKTVWKRDPTLTELNNEISRYRRDLRGLRRDMHSGLPSGATSVPSHGHLPINAQLDASQRAEGLRLRALHEKVAARKLARNMHGSAASPMAKILQLRKHHAAMPGSAEELLAGASRAKIFADGSQSARSASSHAAAAAAAAASAGLDGDGASAAEWQAKRFWRQSFPKRQNRRDTAASAGAMVKVQREQEEEKHPLLPTASGASALSPYPPSSPSPRKHLPLISEYIAGPVTGPTAPLSLSAALAATTLSSPSSRSSSARFRPVRPAGAVGVITPTLADVLARTSSPLHAHVLEAPVPPPSARSAKGAAHAVQGLPQRSGTELTF